LSPGALSHRSDFGFEAWYIGGDIASKIELRFVDRRLKAPRYYRVDDYVLFEPKVERVEGWLEYWRELAASLGLSLRIEEEVVSALTRLKEVEGGGP